MLELSLASTQLILLEEFRLSAPVLSYKRVSEWDPLNPLGPLEKDEERLLTADPVS